MSVISQINGQNISMAKSLYDVDTSTGLTDDSVLTYDSGSSKWIPSSSVALADKATESTKLSSVRKIDGINFNGEGNVLRYATCLTAGNTAAKEITIVGYTLEVGAYVFVEFQNTNSVSNVTLNISSTGAKSLQIGTKSVEADDLIAGHVYIIVYNGTNYKIVSSGFGN